MVKVCEKWFPKGYQKFQKSDGFYMDENLKAQIDILMKNIKKDWDFTIIITGEGEVRVGKSVLAMQLASYWAYEMEHRYNTKVKFDMDNFVFDGRKLIELGNKLGKSFPYSPLIYDEAGADLEGRKSMQTATQDVIDYFRECGQYNMFNILVLPEYFDLPKGIALSRSSFLINVSYQAKQDGIFERGYFYFYSRKKKKELYLKGKKELNYKVVPYNFDGRFTNFYPIDEQEYRRLKIEALKRRESKKRGRFQLLRDASWYLLSYEGLDCKCGHRVKLTQKQLGQRMEGMTGTYVADSTVGDAIKHFIIEDEA